MLGRQNDMLIFFTKIYGDVEIILHLTKTRMFLQRDIKLMEVDIFQMFDRSVINKQIFQLDGN